MKKRLICIVLAFALMLSLCACGGSTAVKISGPTTTFTDSCGREVEIPEEINSVVPSGALAQMVLLTLCPEKLVGLSSNLSRTQKKYFSADVGNLPVFGSFYGGKSTMNFEAVIGTQPDILIDVGEEKATIVEDMDSITKITSTPSVYIRGDLRSLPEAYRTLGKLLGVEERGETLASYIENVLNEIDAGAESISQDERLTVMYGDSDSGLDVKSADSIHAELIDIAGGINVAQTYADGGVSLEQVFNWNPDVIILSPDANYEDVYDDAGWAPLKAVQNGRVYEIPYSPYNWIDKPPSVQRVLGLQWLANILYPDVFDYDMIKLTQEFFELFYGTKLTDDEAMELMINSTYHEVTVG